MENHRVYITRNISLDFYSNQSKQSIGIVISNNKHGKAYKALWIDLNKYTRPTIKVFPDFIHISGYFLSVSLAY